MPAPTHVYAAVAGTVGRASEGKVGVFRRAARAGDWQHVVTTHEAFTVLVHPSSPEYVFAGTADGVMRSTDGGQTFRSTDFPVAGRQVWSLLVDHAKPSRIYAGASPVELYRSEDWGASWQRLPPPGIAERAKAPFAARVMRLAQHPMRPAELYAALEVNGVMVSRDGGETWQDASADLIRLSQLPHLSSKIISDTFAEGMLDGHAIAISPADPDAVILACRMGLFRSTDQGRTWQDLEVKKYSPFTYARDIRAQSGDGALLYAALSTAAASRAGGLFRSEDRGKTWARFDAVEAHGTIMAVALHAADPGQVFMAGRYEGEVFGTMDGGAHWSPMPLPGPVKDIYALACG
jgi:photosystem II stability/assembly factor-like uncharacterized protein